MTAQEDLEQRLRSTGLRLTQPRRRILSVLAAMGHATPEGVAAAIAASPGPGAAPALSTVYRNLEALTAAGLVRHTHLDHAAPSYHLADHGRHLHLVCVGCGTVDEAPLETAEQLQEQLRSRHGFRADLTHTGLRGLCAACAGPEEESP